MSDQVPEGLVQDLELALEAAEDRADRAIRHATEMESLYYREMAHNAELEKALSGMWTTKDDDLMRLNVKLLEATAHIHALVSDLNSWPGQIPVSEPKLAAVQAWLKAQP
jgi:hypothetical protein